MGIDSWLDYLQGLSGEDFRKTVRAVIAVALVMLGLLTYVAYVFFSKWRVEVRALSRERARVAEAAAETRESSPHLKWEEPGARLSDLAALDRVADQLKAVVNAAIDPKKSQLVAGLVLSGPSGVGKTAVASAIAGELGWKLCRIDLRSILFEPDTWKAVLRSIKDSSKALLLLDDADELAGEASIMTQAGTIRQSFVSQLLAAITRPDAKFLVVTCLRNAENLDEDLVRKGPFEPAIRLRLPDTGQRRAIMQLFCETQGVEGFDGILDEYASNKTAGFTPGDLKNLIAAGLQASAGERANTLDPSALAQAARRIRKDTYRRTQSRTNNEPWTWREPSLILEDIGGLGQSRPAIEGLVNELDARIGNTGGILIVGPEGVGKTSLAEAIASELHVAWCVLDLGLVVSSPERLENLTVELMERVPCVALLDNLDVAERTRDGSVYSRQLQHSMVSTLTSLLDRLRDTRVLPIATATSIDAVDSRLLRPGRLDRRFQLSVPNGEARLDIITRLCRRHQVNCSPDALRRLAMGHGPEVGGGTAGYTGADLELLVANLARKGSGAEQPLRLEALTDAARKIGDAVRARIAGAGTEGYGRSLGQPRLESGAGLDALPMHPDVKDELGTLAKALRRWSELSPQGFELPKGVLLVGPPGVGKTTLARALAATAGVPFTFLSATEFVEVYVGVGAARVRDAFRTARAHSPSVIFIDEIDALGIRGDQSRSSETDATLNQLLIEMDGRGPDGVLVVAATNLLSRVDIALQRPGRFDYVIKIKAPTLEGRRAIIRKYVQPDDEISEAKIEELASDTHLSTGAHIASLFRIARLRAHLEDKKGTLDDEMLSAAGRKIRRFRKEPSTEDAPLRRLDKFMSARGEARGSKDSEMDRDPDEFMQS